MKLKSLHIRLALTALLVIILISVVDLDKLVANLKNVSLLALSTAAVGYALTQIISAAKWGVLARAAGIEVGLGRVVRVFYVGMYVNAFCFGTVGGDLVRAFLLTRGRSDKGVSMATVIADRALGLGVLASIGILAGVIFGSIAAQPRIGYTAAAVAILAVAGWQSAPWLADRAGRPFPAFADTFKRLSQAFPRDGRVLTKAVSLAVLYHLSQIAVIGILVREIGGTVPVSYLLFAVPFINIVGTLPLSWMGVGVREAAYVVFFTPHFLSTEQAVLVGVIWLLGMTIASAIGGIVAVVSGDWALIQRRAEKPM